MNVRDYVRTEKGTITKYNAHDIILNEFENRYYYTYDTFCEDSVSELVIKSSPNILDILEPMDLLYIDIDGGFEGGIVVPRIPETLDELNGFVEFIKSGHWILKYVVTHEQLENNMYEVGE